MGLLGVLFKTEQHRKLAELLWADELTASLHEYSKLSGMPYATCHKFMSDLLNQGLVKRTTSGRSTLYSSNVSADELSQMKALLKKSKPESKALSDFPEMDLPLVGDFAELRSEKAQTREEMLVKTVNLSKKSATLLRTMPLLVSKLGPKLNVNQLSFWSKRLHVDKELGFLLELTSLLSNNRKFQDLAKEFRDQRWSKASYFLDKEKTFKGFQAELVERNTPDLAKKWFLKMNVGLDSFRSTYSKFA